jgi:autotransporter translocation and assembly factor TamB
MVADRTAQILASYGSVQLQDWASSQLGLDLVSIEPSADDETATSLVVGKYIDPKVVIRYEQVMSEESAWYVHLEYLMTSVLKLHSVISEGAESGIEMMWYLDR